MILDSDGTSCSTVNLGIGGGAVTRQWDIMVHTSNTITFISTLNTFYYSYIIITYQYGPIVSGHTIQMWRGGRR